MGSGSSGRYSNTRGADRSISASALDHAVNGRFVQTQVKVNGKVQFRPRLAAGGHGQAGMQLLDKYGIEYHVVRTYPNGVRVGYVPWHRDGGKQTGENQSWFPRDWTEKDIRRAGSYVAGLKRNQHVPDGVHAYGTYKGVRVGIIRTNGKIATVFPDSDQTPALKQRRRKK